MKQEYKELLLKDLSARLPYGVKVLDDMGRVYELTIGNSYLIDLFYGNGDYVEPPIKPYLRPMFSMTEEEKKEYKTLLSERRLYGSLGIKIIDWLNAHHFDYHGLIEKGLALPAPVGMYK